MATVSSGGFILMGPPRSVQDASQRCPSEGQEVGALIQWLLFPAGWGSPLVRYYPSTSGPCCAWTKWTPRSSEKTLRQKAEAARVCLSMEWCPVVAAEIRIGSQGRDAEQQEHLLQSTLALLRSVPYTSSALLLSLQGEGRLWSLIKIMSQAKVLISTSGSETIITQGVQNVYTLNNYKGYVY